MLICVFSIMWAGRACGNLFLALFRTNAMIEVVIPWYIVAIGIIHDFISLWCKIAATLSKNILKNC